MLDLGTLVFWIKCCGDPVVPGKLNSANMLERFPSPLLRLTEPVFVFSGTVQSSPVTVSPSGSPGGSQYDSDSDMAFSVNRSSSASESSLGKRPFAHRHCMLASGKHTSKMLAKTKPNCTGGVLLWLLLCRAELALIWIGDTPTHEGDGCYAVPPFTGEITEANPQFGKHYAWELPTG